MEIKKVHISMPTKQLGSLFLLPLMIFGGGEIEKLGNEGCSLAAFFFSRTGWWADLSHCLIAGRVQHSILDFFFVSPFFFFGMKDWCPYDQARLTFL
jgi:hypothetical protein